MLRHIFCAIALVTLCSCAHNKGAKKTYDRLVGITVNCFWINDTICVCAQPGQLGVSFSVAEMYECAKPERNVFNRK